MGLSASSPDSPIAPNTQAFKQKEHPPVYTVFLTTSITRCCSSAVILEPEGMQTPVANNLSAILSTSPLEKYLHTRQTEAADAWVSRRSDSIFSGQSLNDLHRLYLTYFRIQGHNRQPAVTPAITGLGHKTYPGISPRAF